MEPRRPDAAKPCAAAAFRAIWVAGYAGHVAETRACLRPAAARFQRAPRRTSTISLSSAILFMRSPPSGLRLPGGRRRRSDRRRRTVSIGFLRRRRRRASNAGLDSAASVDFASRRQTEIVGFIRFSALVAA